MVDQNPASTIQIGWLVSGIEAIGQDINRQRERLREQHRAQEAWLIQNNRAQEARLIQDNRAQEAQLDAESDERHLRLGMHFESVSGLTRWPGQDARPHESVGNRMPNNHSQFRIPDLLPEDQSRIVSWDRASSHVLEDLNSSRSNLTRNHQASVADGNFHLSLLSARLPSMDADDNTNEAFLDSVERQTLSSTAIGESQADSVPANRVPHADETLGVAPATVLPSGGARNGPSSQFERSPDSGYGSSHTSCMACNTVLIGQSVCDSCADWLDIEPSFWFNG
jgi:hypothetical protein